MFFCVDGWFLVIFPPGGGGVRGGGGAGWGGGGGVGGGGWVVRQYRKMETIQTCAMFLTVAT